MQVRLTVRARRDLLEIWTRIADDGPERADAVLDRIERRFALLAAYPLIGRQRPDIAPSMRILAVERWLILHRIEPEAIVVSRVIDGARDPRQFGKLGS